MLLVATVCFNSDNAWCTIIIRVTTFVFTMCVVTVVKVLSLALYTSSKSYAISIDVHYANYVQWFQSLIDHGMSLV